MGLIKTGKVVKYNNHKGQTYYLHSAFKLKDGSKAYHFSPRINKNTLVNDLPGGYSVKELPNGLPFLKKQ